LASQKNTFELGEYENLFTNKEVSGSGHVKKQSTPTLCSHCRKKQAEEFSYMIKI
jgi:hypothetical protein